MYRLRYVFQTHPWATNVAAYSTLFAGADLLQQCMLGDKEAGPQGEAEPLSKGVVAGQEALWSRVDFSQTAKVALIGFCFHANFNFYWLRALERGFPGGGARNVGKKVVVDQLVAAPATITAFYTGLSVLDRKEDVFEDLRNKFWPSYQTGLVYWSAVQAVNFSLVPPVVRTAFIGGCAFVWTAFLCCLRQHDTDRGLQALLRSISNCISPARGDRHSVHQTLNTANTESIAAQCTPDPKHSKHREHCSTVYTRP
ncbi:mpv17-like protein [Acipenser oxyrinchus oxyrinchus]|uniref:Mpv17-like protein n=1 Tax=Acipenser oxyrinchus oxyrinchus TaxID=40147 RepID=A0AAD8CHK5_ACIOX|nr:mpv17-like protein [Acipenser oxyrinchus oxyrinchus]